MEKIIDGVFIQTREDIQEDQKTWDDGDSSKNMDFSSSPFWVTTDNGVDPMGFDNINEAVISVVDMETMTVEEIENLIEKIKKAL